MSECRLAASLPKSIVHSQLCQNVRELQEGNTIFGKTHEGVVKRGLSPNPVEHKRREKKGFVRELLIAQEPSFWLLLLASQE